LISKSGRPNLATATPPLDRLDRLRGLLAEPGPAVLGDRLRHIRQLQDMSIRNLASAASLSKTTIVRMEAGKSVRPETMLRVCEALSIHVERLATIGDDRPARALVHRRTDDRWVDMADAASGPLLGEARPLTPRERRRAVDEAGIAVPLCILQSRLPGGRVFANLIEVHAESVERSHPGEEFVYVLSGRARISVGAEEFVLETGEAVTFFSAEPHRYAPADPPPAVARLLSVRIAG